MANDATTVVPQGASELARRWYLDVNTNTYASPTWARVPSIGDFKPALDPTEQDDSDYDSGGYKSSTITALAFSLEFKIGRKVDPASPTAYPTTHELLRTTAALMGVSNRLDFRWYEMGSPKIEAYRGYAAVSWQEDGGSMDGLATISVKLTGQGARTAITHPAGAAAVPVLYSVTPATGVQAGGTQHHLYGTGFFAAGVSSVASMKLGVTNVPTYMVLNNNEIVFLAPAKTAAAFVVYVTNAVGESVTATVTLTIS